MPKCLVCGVQLPEEAKYCPPKKLLENGCVQNFGGCYSIRAEALCMPKGGRRSAPKFRSDRWLETLAKT